MALNTLRVCVCMIIEFYGRVFKNQFEVMK